LPGPKDCGLDRELSRNEPLAWHSRGAADVWGETRHSDSYLTRSREFRIDDVARIAGRSGLEEDHFDLLLGHPSTPEESIALAEQAIDQACVEGALPMHDNELLKVLDSLLRKSSVVAQIDSIISRVEEKLAADPSAVMAWEPIPVTIYEAALPEGIHSSWVFILRGGSTTGAERHPNSHQRVAAYRGVGDLQIWIDEHWSSNVLVDNANASLESRWASIPANVWHQAVVASGDWVVVSFHTVPVEELIEERPDPADAQRMLQRLYTAT
jgi:hypothetical protein